MQILLTRTICAGIKWSSKTTPNTASVRTSSLGYMTCVCQIDQLAECPDIAGATTPLLIAGIAGLGDFNISLPTLLIASHFAWGIQKFIDAEIRNTSHVSVAIWLEFGISAERSEENKTSLRKLQSESSECSDIATPLVIAGAADLPAGYSNSKTCRWMELE